MDTPPLDVAEIPFVVQPRTPGFYAVLALVVIPLWSVTPLSWIFVIYSLRSGLIWTYTWLRRACFLLALCEVLFSIYHFYLVKQVSSPSPNAPGNTAEVQVAFTRVLKAGLARLPENGFDEESLDVDRPGSPAEDIVKLAAQDPVAIDFRNCTRNWFRKATWSSIRKEEMYAWLYWSIFNAACPPTDQLSRGHRAILDDALKLLEMRSGNAISEGFNTNSKPILLTLDKVNVTWRPFFWYVFVFASNQSMKAWLRNTWGATFGCYNGLEFCIRVPPSWDAASGPAPILFLHGLGLGLTQYQLTLRELLNSFPDRPLLIPLQPHISQDIFHGRFLKPTNRHQTAESLAGLLRKLGWVPGIDDESDMEQDGKKEVSARGGITVFSHSNGSYVHAWLLKAYPEIVAKSCFVDPVTFCSWEGDVCYNFLYSRCSTALELVMRYFVGTELGVANTLQRHFDWTSNSLWYEEIPNARDPTKTLFVLGGKDAIVNAERVKKYLQSHGVRKGLFYDPEGGHGHALVPGGEGHSLIFEWLAT
ncbi:hypothetical protein CONPUDRAFT_54478 [Coniophora puteana RWD-64-598 SS2]|uniref:Uncharacterized protein n=1 Tax=Coniophora puteana (strain RWD-64-598) TaxID=741705 RepID=A0A5M3MSI2_CONPW|nr:uncharacterized protein CONPUDRAFT_54478 [Coniophora puteana RWD-64-598 SS2]EIW82122.1 hypothetical protein CONPUDRAFT_54478 [Coniophora puteana RWD-64-598 SS2]